MKEFSVMVTALLLTLFFVGGTCCSTTLDGTDVPREKLIVYIMIGHSNMTGRVREYDTLDHPRAWNFFIKDCCQKYPQHSWIPAKDCIHKDYTSCGSGPTVRFLKKMVNKFPRYYFGVVQNANSGAGCRNNYLRGNGAGKLDLFSEMVNALNVIKNEVTFGGIICMLGLDEAVQSSDAIADNFLDDISTMVQQFRDTLGLPELPFIIGGFERDGPRVRIIPRNGDTTNWQTIDSQTNAIPLVVPFSAVVPSDSLAYLDRWHYTAASYDIWTDRAIAVIQQNGWLPADETRHIIRERVHRAPLVIKKYVPVVFFDPLGRKIDNCLMCPGSGAGVACTKDGTMLRGSVLQ